MLNDFGIIKDLELHPRFKICQNFLKILFQKTQRRYCLPLHPHPHQLLLYHHHHLMKLQIHKFIYLLKKHYQVKVTKIQRVN